MGEDRVKAAARQVRDTIRQAIGKLAGHAETRTENTADEPATEAERTRRTIRDPAKE